MEDILLIMKIVTLACVSALSIYLIVVISRVQQIFTNIERDIREMSEKISPVFTNLEAITAKFRNITDGMSDDFEMVRFSLRSLRDAIESIVDFEQRVQQKIEEPVLQTVTTFTAFLKGIRTFLQVMRS
ncbi:MAG: hypothetical protein ACHQQQ_07590 [Bacteroidota bacterium]